MGLVGGTWVLLIAFLAILGLIIEVMIHMHLLLLWRLGFDRIENPGGRERWVSTSWRWLLLIWLILNTALAFDSIFIRDGIIRLYLVNGWLWIDHFQLSCCGGTVSFFTVTLIHLVNCGFVALLYFDWSLGHGVVWKVSCQVPLVRWFLFKGVWSVPGLIFQVRLIRITFPDRI